MALTKVTRSGITDDSINAAKIEDGTIVDADITPGTITNAKLAGSIANAKLANSSITINGSAISLGGSVSAGSLAWQSVVVSDGSTVTTMVAGRGYFVNNTSAAGIVKLPGSASAGDTIAIKDYAGNFGTNKLTIQRNGHNIQGIANDSLIGTNRASVVLVYIDATKGWLFTNESNVADLQNKGYTEATGGTVTTSGDFKIHTFTGDGNFVVSQAGFGPSQLTKVDYLVLAGGGGGGSGNNSPTPVKYGGGGGAGGYRESKDTDISSPHTGSPVAASTGITISAQTYPITVGGGGSGAPAGAGTPSPTGPPTPGNPGSNSVFSTITSAGGGAGGNSISPRSGREGGSGGGAGGRAGGYTGGPGAGNTPPVSPPQGFPGGTGSPSPCSGHPRGAGGGGATEKGANVASNPTPGDGRGGNGADSSITGSPVKRAGGGGADGPGGRINNPVDYGGGGTGGAVVNKGGGGSGQAGGVGNSGSKGIVIIRYKYQN